MPSQQKRPAQARPANGSPSASGRGVVRLTAFAVAPKLSRRALAGALRRRIDPENRMMNPFLLQYFL